jgi:hypothetical protein
VAGGSDKPQVLIETVALGKVWDAKKARDVPDLAGAALQKGLGGKVEVVGSKPKQGFILKPTIDLDLDEKKGELFGRISVVVTDAGKSMLGTETRKGPVKGVEAKNLDAKLKTLAEALGRQVAADCADTIVKAAGGK